MTSERAVSPSPSADGPPLDPRLAEALELVSDAVYVLDREGRYVVFNRAAEQYFGASRELVLGREIWEVFPQGRGTPFEAAVRRALEEGAETRFETASAVRPNHTVELRIAPLTGVGVAVALCDVSGRSEADQRLQLLVNELNHRVKNSMAVVQGLARQSFAASRSLEQARDDFTGRLVAFAAAHDVITEQNWEGADLRQLIERTLAGQLLADRRVVLEGPQVRISPKTALSLSLALHELVTNAFKYGALSNDEGQVQVSWTASGAAGAVRLHLIWAESGGPPVAQPERRGFGVRLLERALAVDLGGQVRLRFEPTGLVCEIEAPAS